MVTTEPDRTQRRDHPVSQRPVPCSACPRADSRRMISSAPITTPSSGRIPTRAAMRRTQSQSCAPVTASVNILDGARRTIMNFRLPDLTATGGAIGRARSRLRAFDEARTDRQYLACRCARTDTPFEAVFTRQRGKPRYALEAVRTPEPQTNQGAAGAAPTTQHDIRHFDLNAVDCPHCGEGRFIKCARCGAFVCGGR